MMCDPDRRAGQKIQRNAFGWPLREIRSRTRRGSGRPGRPWYMHEVLDCGHAIEHERFSGAMERAKRRGCEECYRKKQTP